MPDGWLPTKRSKNVLMDRVTNRVEVVEARPRPNRGRDALILSGVSAFCIVLAAVFGLLHSRPGDSNSWMLGVTVVCSLISVPVGGFGLVYSLLSWKTKLGKIALAINACMAGFVLGLHFLTAGA